MKNVLEIKDLTVDALIGSNQYNVIKDVSLKLKEKQTLAIVGESGSGKSLTSLSVIKLLENNLTVKNGEIIFQNKNLLELDENEINKIRGKEISFVFQEPLTALNPVVNIKTQMTEVLTKHMNMSEKQAEEKAREMLEKVGIDSTKINSYPHNFSGGQRQRILIATALLTNPKILIADEPTTALDVTTQIEILNLIEDMKKLYNMSVMLITHNFSIVANYSDYVYVMYLGQIMEANTTANIIKSPRHPYTKALLNSLVKLEKSEKLETIKGTTPSIKEIPDGCRFKTRCNYYHEKCDTEPPYKNTENGMYKCWL